MHKDDELLLTGQRRGGLLVLDCSICKPAVLNMTVSMDLWHRRLAHRSYNVMQRMARHAMLPNIPAWHKQTHEPCETCVQCNQVQEPHPRSENRAKRPLERLHSDLMKEPVVDMRDNQHELTLSDDYSRYAEVALLPNKGQVAPTMVGMLKRFERQTERQVKYLRTDGGTEYKGVLRQYMHNTGITHEVTMPYTPQQNGRAERTL